MYISEHAFLKRLQITSILINWRTDQAITEANMKIRIGFSKAENKKVIEK
jgi:hypothetical protein